MPPRKSIPLRMSPRLYEALRRWAEEDFRSVNGQIEWLCHEALRRAGRLPRQRDTGPGGGSPGGPAPEGDATATPPEDDRDAS